MNFHIIQCFGHIQLPGTVPGSDKEMRTVAQVQIHGFLRFVDPYITDILFFKFIKGHFNQSAKMGAQIDGHQLQITLLFNAEFKAEIWHRKIGWPGV